MTRDEARQSIIHILRRQGKATNSQLLRALGGDADLFAEVREELLLDDIAREKTGAGLVYVEPVPTTADLSGEPAEGGTAPLPNAPMIFISYGRADGLLFARRLAKDLRDRGGHCVWLDMEKIEGGGLFEVRIEQGLRAATIVAAVMTPMSVREESVCRDEIVFALNANLPVVPLRVDAEVQPPLLLARRNWIDFTIDYEEGLTSLLNLLAGTPVAPRPSWLATVSGLIPLDFGPEIARYSAGFVGRKWVVQELERWLAHEEPRGLVIVGEPGSGKSAFAAWLCLNRIDVIGVHFCTQRNTPTLDPRHLVASLVGQLYARLSGFAEVVENRRPEIRRDRAGDAFRTLIVEPTRHLATPPRPCFLVIDSLDEAANWEGETIVDVLVEHIADLPAWLRIVATTRQEARVLDRVRSLRVFNLEADRIENRVDVQAYVASRCENPALAARLEQLALGNFLYARLALDSLQEGTLGQDDLFNMTPGLAGFYERAFRQRFRDVDAYTTTHAPLLGILAVAQSPLSFDLLRAAVAEEAEVVHRRLRELLPYLRVTQADEAETYTLFHKSLVDWLKSRRQAGDFWCPPSKGHARLAGALQDRWQDEYRWKSLSYHLYEAEQLTSLRQLIDANFLREKVRRCGYAVLEDIQLLTKAMLKAEDATLVERCVELVEGLREVVGGDIIEEARTNLRPRTVSASPHSRFIVPAVPTVSRLDVYAGMLPRIEVGSDFCEMLPYRGGLVLALGDAPGAGLKSAFVARFLGNLLRNLVERTANLDVGQLLDEMQRLVGAHEYFETIALQCAQIVPGDGLVTLASAGGPFPVLYHCHRGKCDQLPVRGGRLVSGESSEEPSRYLKRHVEIESGDVLVLVSDGLTEGRQLQGNPYGYRFTDLVEKNASGSAKSIGEAIVDGWRAHLRTDDFADDVTILVVKIAAGPIL